MLKIIISLAAVVTSVFAAGFSGPYSPQEGGKATPLLPEEYAFNFVQHKWNENGFGVSHVAAGSWLSSIKHGKLRNDISSYDWVSNNATIKGKLKSSVVTSVFDFSRTGSSGNVTNTYITANGLDRTCNVDEISLAQSQGQLFPSDFLKQQNAIYAGQETVTGIGYTYLTDKWVIVIGNTFVSFYFNEAGDWVRFDQNSQGLQTSVVTWIYNLNKEAEFDDSVFSINGCSAPSSS